MIMMVTGKCNDNVIMNMELDARTQTTIPIGWSMHLQLWRRKLPSLHRYCKALQTHRCDAIWMEMQDDRVISCFFMLIIHSILHINYSVFIYKL